MNALSAKPRHPNIGQRIRAWWLNGQTNPEQDIMGSPGRWDPTLGEPREIMAGRNRTEISALPEVMGTSRQWNPAVEEPREVMAGPSRDDEPQLPYLMSSPGTGNPSDAGPQDVMGAGQP
jgi:hypothetical protein